MDTVEAARRWGTTWERAWREGDVAAIVALYAPEARYRSHPHREPEAGGALGYASRVFAEESNVQCWFGQPMVADDRAAVEWWGTFDEGPQRVTLSGVTVLRFNASGSVIDHVDHWVQTDGLVERFSGWGARL